jgi:hypothetical protein
VTRKIRITCHLSLITCHCFEMLMSAISSLSSSAKEIVGNVRAFVVFFVVYLALVGAVALFIVTNLATFRAVFFTFISMLLAPVVFFLLQTLCVSFTAKSQAREWLKNSLGKFWKVFLVSLPLIAMTILIYRLLALFETQQANVIVSTIRFLLFAFIFPLVFIHLWIETIRTDVVDALKNFKAVLSKAFAPLSVLIYFCGLLIFAFIPYLLLSPQIKLQQSNVVIGLLIFRVIIALLLVFFGWIVTVNALSKNTSAR